MQKLTEINKNSAFVKKHLLRIEMLKKIYEEKKMLVGREKLR